MRVYIGVAGLIFIFIVISIMMSPLQQRVSARTVRLNARSHHLRHATHSLQANAPNVGADTGKAQMHTNYRASPQPPQPSMPFSSPPRSPPSFPFSRLLGLNGASTATATATAGSDGSVEVSVQSMLDEFITTVFNRQNRSGILPPVNRLNEWMREANGESSVLFGTKNDGEKSVLTVLNLPSTPPVIKLPQRLSAASVNGLGDPIPFFTSAAADAHPAVSITEPTGVGATGGFRAAAPPFVATPSTIRPAPAEDLEGKFVETEHHDNATEATNMSFEEEMDIALRAVRFGVYDALYGYLNFIGYQLEAVAFFLELTQQDEVVSILFGIGSEFLAIGYLFVGIKGSEEIDVAVRGVDELLARGPAAADGWGEQPYVSWRGAPATEPEILTPPARTTTPRNGKRNGNGNGNGNGDGYVHWNGNGKRSTRLPPLNGLYGSYVTEQYNGVVNGEASRVNWNWNGNGNGGRLRPLPNPAFRTQSTMGSNDLYSAAELNFPELLYGNWRRLEMGERFDGRGLGGGRQSQSKSGTATFGSASNVDSSTPTSVLLRFTHDAYERLERRVHVQPLATGKSATKRTQRAVKLRHQRCQISEIECEWVEADEEGGEGDTSSDGDGWSWSHRLDAGWQTWSPFSFTIAPHVRANITVQLHACGGGHGGRATMQEQSGHDEQQRQVHFTLLQLTPSMDPTQFSSSSPANGTADSNNPATPLQFVLVEFGVDDSRKAYVRVDAT